MNRQPDVEHVLRDYFADDGFAAPDHILDVVEARIARQPRRSAWRLQGRPFMNTYAKVGAGLAAAFVVAFVAWQLLPGGGTGPQPTPTPSPTTSPTAAPTPIATAVGIRDVPDIGGRLDPGQWRFHLGTGGSSLAVVADMPAGWLAIEAQHGIENAIATNSAPSGIAILFEMPANGLFSDACRWDVAGSGNGEQNGDVAVGPTVADLVGALRANASYTSSTASPVAFGPYSGQALELRFPPDLDPETCDAETGADAGQFRVMPDTIYSQGKANIWRMSVVDVAGTRIVTILEYFPGTDPAKLAEAAAIVDSFEFNP